MVDAVGDQLFGRALRLRVLLWVRDHTAVFFQGEAARGVEYSQAAVAKELATLEALGMVRKFGRPNNAGRQNYLAVDSPLWAVVDAARAAMEVQAEELRRSQP